MDYFVQEGDPLAYYAGQLLNIGFYPVPQIATGFLESALLRVTDDRRYLDVLTLPVFGYATVVRAFASWSPTRPREHGAEVWRHLVPAQIAAQFLLSNPEDDAPLREWRREHIDSSRTDQSRTDRLRTDQAENGS